MKKKVPNKHNYLAKALAHPLFRNRRIPSKKLYKRPKMNDKNGIEGSA